MNRLVSNLVLGLFVLVLVVVYGVVKQPAVWSVRHTESNSTASPDTESADDGIIAADTRSVVLSDGTTLSVQIADTPEARTYGLSGVESLPSNSGMLFIYPVAGQHGIWMKEMQFDLDILWLDDDGKVVELVKNAPRPEEGQLPATVYTNSVPARYVLEVPAGTADALGIALETQLVIT